MQSQNYKNQFTKKTQKNEQPLLTSGNQRTITRAERKKRNISRVFPNISGSKNNQVAIANKT